MTLRVTPSLSISQFINQLTRQNSRIAGLEQQASTGLRISRPSDDPSGLRSMLSAEEAVNRLDTRLETIVAARYRLEQANTAVLDVQNLFVQAEVAALQAVQAIEPVERTALANEVSGLLRQLESIANLQVSGEYLFAGIASDRAPFENAASSDVTTYVGSTVPRTMQLLNGQPSVVLSSGAKVFQPQARAETVFLGNTGAAAGTATDTGQGQGTLVVTHTATSFAAGAGVSAGIDSANADTIIGPAGANRLTLSDDSGTGAFGTVSLNGGTPVAFSNTDTNLQVVGPLGEIAYIDTTAITAGFSGDVDITATGTLSTDGGVTTIPIDFSANQAVTDSVTGAITNVDSTAIRTPGSEQLEYSGTADAFAVLRELRDDILNVRGLSNSEQKEALGRRLSELQRVGDNLLDVVGEQSVTLTYLNDVETQAENSKLEFQRKVVHTSAADIAKVALDLELSRAQLQYSLATASRLFDVTLLDYLR